MQLHPMKHERTTACIRFSRDPKCNPGLTAAFTKRPTSVRISISRSSCAIAQSNASLITESSAMLFEPPACVL